MKPHAASALATASCFAATFAAAFAAAAAATALRWLGQILAYASTCPSLSGVTLDGRRSCCGHVGWRMRCDGRVAGG